MWLSKQHKRTTLFYLDAYINRSILNQEPSKECILGIKLLQFSSQFEQFCLGKLFELILERLTYIMSIPLGEFKQKMKIFKLG